MNAVALVVLLAFAQPADEKRAREFYEAGLAAYQLGNFAEAAKQFEEAYRLVKMPVVLFSTAQCHRRLFENQHTFEHARKALELYQAFLRDAPATAENRAAAEKLIPELERAIAAEEVRRRMELVGKANGRDALPIADSLIADGALEDAALLLDRVLSSRGNPRDVLLGALQKRGLVAGRTGQVDVARETFSRALALDPGLQLPKGADAATTSAWADARKRLDGRKPLGFSHVPLGEVRSGQPARITIDPSSDPLGQIEQFMVYYRSAGRGAYSSVRARRNVGAIEIPAAFLSGLTNGTRVEYYIAALDPLDAELVLAGSPHEPFVFAITSAPPKPIEEAPRSWYRRWWVWALVGGAAVAGGTAIFFSARGEDTLTVHFPAN